MVYSSCTVSICHFCFQVFTSLYWMCSRKKSSCGLPLLCRGAFLVVTSPCVSVQFSTAFFSFSILIAGIRGVWIPHRFPQAAPLDHSGDSLRTKCFSAETDLKRLKWDCVSSACLCVFFFLRKAVDSLKNRYKSGETLTESSFHHQISHSCSLPRLWPRRYFCLRRIHSLSKRIMALSSLLLWGRWGWFEVKYWPEKSLFLCLLLALRVIGFPPAAQHTWVLTVFIKSTIIHVRTSYWLLLESCLYFLCEPDTWGIAWLIKHYCVMEKSSSLLFLFSTQLLTTIHCLHSHFLCIDS